MARYIDAVELIKAIEENQRNTEHHKDGRGKQIHVSEHRHFIKMVYEQPTADVQELRHGEWKLETHSFYADNWNESIELKIYITAACGNCGRKHPDRYEVYYKSLYAPDDAPEDFRFDEESEKSKALVDFLRSNYRFADFCPNCGAKMDGKE